MKTFSHEMEVRLISYRKKDFDEEYYFFAEYLKQFKKKLYMQDDLLISEKDDIIKSIIIKYRDQDLSIDEYYAVTRMNDQMSVPSP